MKTSHLLIVMVVFVTGVFGYALLAPDPQREPAGDAAGRPGASASPTGPPPAYDVTALLAPSRKYLGVALSGAPQDMSRVDAFADLIGNRPNLITLYESFDDPFAAAEVRKIYQYGALPIVRWEPFKAKLADIAAGKYDLYITEFATAVRTLNLPIALTIAHEMNGYWYPWGAHANRPEDFVAAWRHIHALFARVDATNVIWTWTPNVVNPVPKVRLAPLYPGDDYVHWIGLDGYFTRKGEQTFVDLFQPTIREVQAFTTKPFLIVETGSEPGSLRARAVNDLLSSVATTPHLLGFVYFNQKGSGDWVLDSDTAAVATYRNRANSLGFGFPVK